MIYVLQRTITNVLQRTATYYNVLQRTTTYDKAFRRIHVYASFSQVQKYSQKFSLQRERRWETHEYTYYNVLQRTTRHSNLYMYMFRSPRCKKNNFSATENRCMFYVKRSSKLCSKCSTSTWGPWGRRLRGWASATACVNSASFSQAQKCS